MELRARRHKTVHQIRREMHGNKPNDHSLSEVLCVRKMRAGRKNNASAHSSTLPTIIRSVGHVKPWKRGRWRLRDRPFVKASVSTIVLRSAYMELSYKTLYDIVRGLY